MSPLISKQHGRVDSILLLSALALLGAMAAFAYNIWQVSISAGWDEQYRSVASELRLTTQNINVSSREAFAGDLEAFAALEASMVEFPRGFSVLRRGRGSLPQPGPSMDAYLAPIEESWEEVSTGAGAILSAKTRILFIRNLSKNLDINIKNIQAYYADLVDVLADQRLSNATLLAAQQQLWLIERIGRNIDRILEGNENAQAAAEEFKQDALLFQRNMEGLSNGDRLRGINRLSNRDAIDSMNMATDLYAQISDSVNDIYDAHPELIRAARAAAMIAETTPQMSANVGSALAHIDQLADDRQFSGTTATYIGALCLVLLLLISLRMNGGRAQEKQLQLQAELTQEEVQKKVFEIQPLAEGNLTKDLTETDGITQPIAVAINQLIAWIREVVTSVKNSSLKVNEAVQQSAKASSDVKASLEEVGSIVADTASTSSELALINNHMAELAETTDQASDEAVDAARQGDDGIKTLMVSVEEIRESQQTVAKTSKRLGDDIEIVADLLFKIREVANAISTLAMNTRIEAASYSGEGGQRFAGIADETGKLANQTNDIVQEADRAIRSVSNRMAESNRNMEGATQSLVKLSGIASDVRERFGRILSLSENTRNYMGDMRQQIEQSGQSSGAVTNSVSDILEKILGTQQAANRMNSATNQVRELFEHLLMDTQRFKLAEDGQAARPRPAPRKAPAAGDDEVVALRKKQVSAVEVDLDLDSDAFNEDLEKKAS